MAKFRGKRRRRRRRWSPIEPDPLDVLALADHKRLAEDRMAEFDALPDALKPVVDAAGGMGPMLYRAGVRDRAQAERVRAAIGLRQAEAAARENRR